MTTTDRGINVDEVLEARLGRLERAEQVRSTLARYCRAVDERDLAGLEAHFAADATFRGADGVVREGRDAILAFFSDLFTGTPAELSARHYACDIDIDTSEDDRIKASAIFLMVVAGGTQLLGIGTYRDEFVVSDGQVACVNKFIVLENTIAVPPVG